MKFDICISCLRKQAVIWVESLNGEELPFCMTCEPENMDLFTANQKDGQPA